MARGTQLLELIAMLRAETGRTQDVSVGLDEQENLKRILRRVQETLYDDHKWLHMRVEGFIQLNAGQRYYDTPSDVDFDRLVTFKLNYNEVFTEVQKGITFDDFSVFNSTNDERSSPTLKWDVRYTGTTEQVEFWPIPNRADKMYYFGTKKLGALIQESDRAELDDHLVVLFAAAEMLKRQKSADADLKLAAANSRLLKLKANAVGDEKPVQVGQGNKVLDQSNRLKTRIIVS